jgi:Txe/YoeB family toxin of toxin-antitoxin system
LEKIWVQIRDEVNPRTFRINSNNSFSGLGKPEPLKHQLSGLWSRRINKEHRIIYEVFENERDKTINVLSLKGHYERI